MYFLASFILFKHDVSCCSADRRAPTLLIASKPLLIADSTTCSDNEEVTNRGGEGGEGSEGVERCKIKWKGGRGDGMGWDEMGVEIKEREQTKGHNGAIRSHYIISISNNE
jgi:hypothetical protein